MHTLLMTFHTPDAAWKFFVAQSEHHDGALFLVFPPTMAHEVKKQTTNFKSNILKKKNYLFNVNREGKSMTLFNILLPTEAYHRIKIKVCQIMYTSMHSE